MPLEHENRCGDRYFVLQGKTKTGKPKYYASKKNNGTPVEELPPDLEIFEHADTALVSIRKRKPSRLSPPQRELVCNRIRELTDLEFFRVDIDGDDLIIYIPDRDPNLATAALARIFGESESSLSKIRDWTGRNSRYVAELKFTLIDPVHEMFAAARYCYRGSVDDWITLDIGKPLKLLADRYLPHLGAESFFDLV